MAPPIRMIADDGDTIIGKDDDGNLYTGTPVEWSYAQEERTVVDNGDGTWSLTYSLGGEVYGKGTLDHDPDIREDGTPYVHVPQPRFGPGGVEQTRTVIQWEAM